MPVSPTKAATKAIASGAMLRTLIAERGGALSALGYRPALAPIISGFGTPAGAGLLRRFLLNPKVAEYGAGGAVAGGAIGAAIGAAGGAEAGGAAGGPPGVLIGAGIGAAVGEIAALIQSATSGRPKAQATRQAIGILTASNNPSVRAVGIALARALQRGAVLSSPSGAALIGPALHRAVSALAAQGYNRDQVFQLFSNAFRGGASIVPGRAATLPRAIVGRGQVNLKPGYRIHDLRGMGAIAPAELAGAPSPYQEAPAPESPPFPAGQTAPVAAVVRAAAPVAELTPTVPAGQLGLVSRAAQFFGVEQAGTAVYRLLHGEPLDAEQFGSLAGVIIGGLAGDPLAGAQVGLEAGAAVQYLDRIATQYFGRSIDSMLGQAGQAALQALRARLAPQPAPIPTPAPQPAPGPQEIVTQPQPVGTLAQQERQIVERMLARQPGGQPEPQPLTRQIETQPQPTPQPLLTHQPGGCYSEEQMRELVDCPNFQRALLDRLEIVQLPGQRPEISVKEPVCICCDSVQDLRDYVATNGARGKCTQAAAPQTELVGLKNG